MSVAADPPLRTVPASFCRLGLVANGWAEDGGPPYLLVGPAERGAVEYGLTPPLSGFLDSGGGGVDGLDARCRATLAGGGLVLSLTTAAVCVLPVVDLAAEAIRRRFDLPAGELAERVEICLAEALGNAVIHGNLAIPGHLRTSPHGFERFRQVMTERLRDPMLAERRVEIHALRADENSFTLLVSDQGCGFDLRAQIEREIPIDAHCGRGLDLIRRGCDGFGTEDGGRTLRMMFLRRERRDEGRKGGLG